MQELEGEGQMKQAEQHYCDAKDWRAAVNMFRNNDMWEDAYRVGENCFSCTALVVVVVVIGC